MSRATHGVVSIAALDVRGRPDHRSELTSQLLLGEVVRLTGSRLEGQWWRVENLADGYRGWVRGWGLVPATFTRARNWQSRARGRVAVPMVEALARKGRSALVSPLFLGSRVIPGAARGGWRRVELPDGRRGWVPAAKLTLRGEKPALLERVMSLLGAPYHWGGRTPLGLDCSAFVQLVLGEQGVCLPRDAAHQVRVSRRLQPGEEPLPGDLVFFAAPGAPPGHIGIGLGGGYFAHCRGMVRIGSVESSNPLCDKALMSQLVGWRRPVEIPPGDPRRRGGRGDSA